MPWPQRDPTVIRRPCCGATIPVEAFLRGSVLLPHKPTCRYTR